MLLLAAPKVAEMFRTDPKVAELLDPAVYIGADEEGVIASIVERLKLMEPTLGMESTVRKAILENSPKGALIAVLVIDESGASAFHVPDPRSEPEQWPWMGLEDDED